jgi:RNA polymerase sigma-70 factor (ECF subfamily)
MIPTLANGQTATATYHRAGDGTYHALGLAILTVTPAGITRITRVRRSPPGRQVRPPSHLPGTPAMTRFGGDSYTTSVS